LNAWSAEALDLHHKQSDFTSYHFADVVRGLCKRKTKNTYHSVWQWQCSAEEANRRVGAFYRSDSFRLNGGIEPIVGAKGALLRLKASGCRLFVVTSRQNAIRDVTVQWIHTHYQDIFDDILHGNHYAADGGRPTPKSTLCKSVGATMLVDDNVIYARECAEAGIRVAHLNLAGKYPWARGLAPHEVRHCHGIARKLWALVFTSDITPSLADYTRRVVVGGGARRATAFPGRGAAGR
jgi:hypothetical protein